MTGGICDLSGRPSILLGAGGHARVVLELAIACGASVKGVCDPELSGRGVSLWHTVPVLGGDDYLNGVTPEDVWILNGIGMMPGSGVRHSIFQRLSQAGFEFPALTHPAAWVAGSATLEAGAQIMAGAIVQAGVFVGLNTIINTRSSVDHDSLIGSHCHIAPGVTLCGDVQVGDHTFIGAGATVIQSVAVGANAFVKAGQVVTGNVL
ncbi:acetyltransferase [Marinobacter confluentis]|uniref:Acetyltransferase n=1 Tax=Marinobacter confluentis TaxID=1697557 RepID=A0A4Z1BJE6_9GAMM|nr:acetyltransferase [Marinobacter confluentis]TGN39927.1 acetyltransferase [Marinobacter confluentis]